MRRFFLIALTILSFSNFLSAQARLQLSDDREASPTELRKRIRHLQEAVIDLQTRVDQLEARLGAGANAATGAAATAANVTCFIETPFDGVFDATAPTETKSRIEAVKACMARVKSRIHCSSQKVKCGQ